MIAITAATGQLGHYVIESLMKTVPASQIVAIVRNPAKAQALAALEHGVFIGAAGDGKIASATRADYAAAAARVISEAGHEGKVYELAGDSAWTLTQLAAELTKQSGKSVTYQNLSEADFAAALKSVGLPDGLADMLADSDVGASKGGLFDNSKTLSKLIGRPTTTLAESVSHLFNVNN
ncbi:hypothetical protein ACNIUU_16280 [Escherichia coli]